MLHWWGWDKIKRDLNSREEKKNREDVESKKTNRILWVVTNDIYLGRFGHMINDLNTNTTNLEFTTSGMDLRPAQIKVLISNVQNNSSLKGLTMCRKRLTDL